MIKRDIPILFIVCFMGLGITFSMVNGCANKVIPPIKKIQYVKDTIRVEDTLKIIELENVLQLTRDSLNAYKNDTIMSEDEFILRFKLERIRYYNECAGKGNNIKFLRGWINRVLNE